MTPQQAWRTSGDSAIEIGEWRTSSYSGNGQNCVDVAPWRTSGHSGNGENCVEVAPSAGGVLLRDTKDHGAGPVIPFTAAQWSTFVAETRADAPSANGAVRVVHHAGGTDVHVTVGETVLRFTPGEWRAFRNGALDGEFDTLIAA